MARPFYFAIEGVIGVGKTTLARLLQPRLGAELLLEAFDRNPFLSDFYADRARYAFQTQIFFLLSRLRQGQAVAPQLASGSLIADYIFAKDSLFAHLNLHGDELDMYERLYEVLLGRVVQPQLVVYLRASPEVLIARIAMRDRSYERTMDRRYIEQLWGAYERYFAAYAETPLLVVDTDELDFVQRPAEVDLIGQQIRAQLALGAYQRALPQLELTRQSAPMAPWPVAAAGEAQQRPALQASLDEFLATSVALGHVGAALGSQVRASRLVNGEQTSSGAQTELQAALSALLDRVQGLSRAVGAESLEPR